MPVLNRKHDRYMELIEEFPLKPIHNDRELSKAEKQRRKLLEIEHLDLQEKDYLAVLGTLIGQYEDKHHPFPDDATDAQVLAHLIQAQGVSNRRVAAETRIRESAISELLSGKRPFNKNHIERFAHYFRVSPAVFFSK